MSKHLLFHVKPKPFRHHKRWQRTEGNLTPGLDARGRTPHPELLPRAGADDPRMIKWSSG